MIFSLDKGKKSYYVYKAAERGLYSHCGDDSGEDPPVLIPNTEVKLSCAESTLGLPHGRLGCCRIQRQDARIERPVFCLVHISTFTVSGGGNRTLMPRRVVKKQPLSPCRGGVSWLCRCEQSYEEPFAPCASRLLFAQCGAVVCRPLCGTGYL